MYLCKFSNVPHWPFLSFKTEFQPLFFSLLIHRAVHRFCMQFGELKNLYQRLWECKYLNAPIETDLRISVFWHERFHAKKLAFRPVCLHESRANFASENISSYVWWGKFCLTCSPRPVWSQNFQWSHWNTKYLNKEKKTTSFAFDPRSSIWIHFQSHNEEDSGQAVKLFLRLTGVNRF